MKITLLPSALAEPGAALHQYATSFLVNDRVAFDAGSLGFHGAPRDQAAVQHLFLSHSHIDHLASLPLFLENIIGLTESPVTVYASEAVQECLRLDVFNGRLWPNFLDLTSAGVPFLKLETLRNGQVVVAGGMRVTPIAVDHVVPTLGFLIEDATSGIVISSDTAPTEAIWAAANRMANLQAVFLEATFPDELADLARLTKHLTPAQFVAEARKLQRPTRFFAVHLRARLRDQVARELLAHGLPNLEIAQFGTTYEF
jgi:ribonuclease BN (tRNA processing enzyme)